MTVVVEEILRGYFRKEMKKVKNAKNNTQETYQFDSVVQVSPVSHPFS